VANQSERLGVRGTLTLVENALKLLGGANATGALSVGVAYHTFSANTSYQTTIKVAGILFLIGVALFAVAYALWFMTAIEWDQSLKTSKDKDEESLIFDNTKVKSAEEWRKSAKQKFTIVVLLGLASFAVFLYALAHAMYLSMRL